MPAYLSANALPAYNGQQLGNPAKRWALYATDIDFTGTLTGVGLQAWNIVNPIPDSNSVYIQSDNGSGQVLLRFAVQNDSGNGSITSTHFHNSQVYFGDPADGGQVATHWRAAVADVGYHLSVWDVGAMTRRVFGIDYRGHLYHRNPAVAGTWAWLLYMADEAMPRFLVNNLGALMFGPGGAVAPDWGLERTGVNIGRVTNAAGGPGDLRVRQLYSDVAPGTAPLVIVSTTRVANLNADLLDGFDWNSPPVIGAVARDRIQGTVLDASDQIIAGAPNGTAPFLVTSTTKVPNLTVARVQDGIHDGTINPDGQAIKHMRVNIVSTASGARRTVTATWITPFPGAGYTCAFYVFDFLNPGTPGLILERCLEQDANHVAVQVLNQGAESRTGSLHVIAMRDS